MSKLKRGFESFTCSARAWLERTVIAQGDGDGGEGERVGDGKHGVAGTAGQDAELEGGGEHLVEGGERDVREGYGAGEGRGVDVRGFRFQYQALHVADVGDFNEVRGAESVFEHDVLRVDGRRDVQNLEHKM